MTHEFELDETKGRTGSRHDGSAAGLSRKLLERVASGELAVSSLCFEPEDVRTTATQLPYKESEFAFLEPKGEDPAEEAFHSQAIFAQVALREVVKPVRIYQRQDEELRIVVPEEYAVELDAVRALRKRASGQGEGREVASSQRGSPHSKGGVLPEELLVLLDAMPDRTLVTEVILAGHTNPFDPYYQHRCGAEFRSTADSAPSGQIGLYQRVLEPQLFIDLAHEWGHLLGEACRVERQWFTMAERLEADGYFARPYARLEEENWAVHMGEHLLHPEGAGTWYLGAAAPIRCVVLARALGHRLAEVQERYRSPHHGHWRERVDFVEREVMPIARSRLIEIANASSGVRANNALSLLIHLGRDHDLARITNGSRVSLAGQYITDVTLERLPRIAGLVHLNLSSTSVTERGLGTLRELPLQTLRLSGLEIGNAILHALSRITTLRTLDLSFTQISDHGLTALTRMPALESVDVRGTRVTPEAMREILKRKPGLQAKYPAQRS